MSKQVVTRFKGTKKTMPAKRGDRDAIEIGDLYEQSNSSLIGAVRARLECGRRLTAKKDSLPHGAWLPWLEDNAGDLGFFSRNTAAVLMRAAKCNASVTFEDLDEVVTISRQMWGHDKMDVHHSSDDHTWETPQDLFNELDAEFGFELDVCALAETAKCERYFSPAENGLAQDWVGVCWMNPPYGTAISAWVLKARLSAEAGATVVCLVPARVDTDWWWENCRYGEIRFLRGRLKFGGAENSAPFPSAVVVFGREPCVVWWERGSAKI